MQRLRRGLLTVWCAGLVVAPAVEGADREACSAECPIVAATLDLHYDPGHSGYQERYEVSREGDRPFARLTTRAPSVDGSEPGGLAPAEDREPETSELATSLAEVGRFLDELAAIDVCDLEAPEAHFGLHPIFVTLSLRDACGGQREVEWVTERCERPDGRYCPDEPFASLPDRFAAFFEER